MAIIGKTQMGWEKEKDKNGMLKSINEYEKKSKQKNLKNRVIK